MVDDSRIPTLRGNHEKLVKCRLKSIDPGRSVIKVIRKDYTVIQTAGIPNNNFIRFCKINMIFYLYVHHAMGVNNISKSI